MGWSRFWRGGICFSPWRCTGHVRQECNGVSHWWGHSQSLQKAHGGKWQVEWRQTQQQQRRIQSTYKIQQQKGKLRMTRKGTKPTSRLESNLHIATTKAEDGLGKNQYSESKFKPVKGHTPIVSIQRGFGGGGGSIHRQGEFCGNIGPWVGHPFHYVPIIMAAGLLCLALGIA